MQDVLSKEKLAQMSAQYHAELFDNVLPFWLKCVDEQYGGIMTCVDRKGEVFDTDKGIWQQGRFAWVLGHLYNHERKNPQWLNVCKNTLDFLQLHGFDSDGRMFFHVTREGYPIRKRRYAFSESFAAIAFGEYARATGSDQAAVMAENCYNLFANHVPYPPKFTSVRPCIGMAPNMINIVTAQQLRESIGLADANDRIDQAIETIQKYFVKDDLRCVMEQVAPDGSIIDSCDGRMLNPGHAIEGAWFIMNEGKIRKNSDYIKLGLKILDYMWERGWDDQFGGLFYFRDVYNKPVTEYWQDMKFWWNHNEAIIASLMAYELTGDVRYAKLHMLVREWAYRYFPDHEFGDWYGYLHRDGSVATPHKGNLYKGCFHLPRMLWTCYKLCNTLQNKEHNA